MALKKILFSVFCIALCCAFSASTPDQLRDIARKLYGKIHVAANHEKYDYKVRIVDGGEDLRVKITERPQRHGQWKFVDRAADADFSIRFAKDRESFDLKVKFVTSGEGSAR